MESPSESYFKERLRLKIIERLLKEGSSAEEPLNIPLSDYSSDEGDTSSSSDNEGKADRFSDLEGPCCQPLKAPPCSPEYNAVQRRKLRKKKQRSKSSNLVHRSHKRDHRTPLDMPTTDPGSDLFFSTDDEIFADGDGAGIFSTVPRSRRYLLQSDLQRRYIDTIVDGASSQPVQRMPPELIVTPAKHGTSSNKLLRTPEKQKPAQLLPTGMTEFPPVAGSLTRRTNSWHNLHSGGKCIPKLRVQNIGQTERGSNEEQFMLKKKIWTGCSPEPGCCGNRPRPLSWAMPPIQRQREKNKEHDDQEAFFLACSQKLVAWQQENTAYGHRNKINLNLVNPEFPGDKTLTQRPKKIPKTSSKLDIDLKVRKKKSNFMKFTETSRIISCLTKANCNNGISCRKNPSGVPYTPNASMTLAPLTSSSRHHHHHATNKFKTGGLVATAVQPSKKIKRRSLVSINKPIAMPQVEAAVPCQLENEKSFARKVKTKLKKKKSVAAALKSKS